jgi:hypothetical protein
MMTIFHGIFSIMIRKLSYCFIIYIITFIFTENIFAMDKPNATKNIISFDIMKGIFGKKGTRINFDGDKTNEAGNIHALSFYNWINIQGEKPAQIYKNYDDTEFDHDPFAALKTKENYKKEKPITVRLNLEPGSGKTLDMEFQPLVLVEESKHPKLKTLEDYLKNEVFLKTCAGSAGQFQTGFLYFLDKDKKHNERLGYLLNFYRFKEEIFYIIDAQIGHVKTLSTFMTRDRNLYSNFLYIWFDKESDSKQFAIPPAFLAKKIPEKIIVKKEKATKPVKRQSKKATQLMVPHKIPTQSPENSIEPVLGLQSTQDQILPSLCTEASASELISKALTQEQPMCIEPLETSEPDRTPLIEPVVPGEILIQSPLSSIEPVFKLQNAQVQILPSICKESVQEQGMCIESSEAINRETCDPAMQKKNFFNNKETQLAYEEMWPEESNLDNSELLEEKSWADNLIHLVSPYQDQQSEKIANTSMEISHQAACSTEVNNKKRLLENRDLSLEPTSKKQNINKSYNLGPGCNENMESEFLGESAMPIEAPKEKSWAEAGMQLLEQMPYDPHLKIDGMPIFRLIFDDNNFQNEKCEILASLIYLDYDGISDILRQLNLGKETHPIVHKTFQLLFETTNNQAAINKLYFMAHFSLIPSLNIIASSAITAALNAGAPWAQEIILKFAQSDNEKLSLRALEIISATLDIPHIGDTPNQWIQKIITVMANNEAEALRRMATKILFLAIERGLPGVFAQIQGMAASGQSPHMRDTAAFTLFYGVMNGYLWAKDHVSSMRHEPSQQETIERALCLCAENQDPWAQQMLAQKESSQTIIAQDVHVEAPGISPVALMRSTRKNTKDSSQNISKEVPKIPVQSRSQGKKLAPIHIAPITLSQITPQAQESQRRIAIINPRSKPSSVLDKNLTSKQPSPSTFQIIPAAPSPGRHLKKTNAQTTPSQNPGKSLTPRRPSALIAPQIVSRQHDNTFATSPHALTATPKNNYPAKTIPQTPATDEQRKKRILEIDAEKLELLLEKEQLLVSIRQILQSDKKKIREEIRARLEIIKQQKQTLLIDKQKSEKELKKLDEEDHELLPEPIKLTNEKMRALFLEQHELIEDINEKLEEEKKKIAQEGRERLEIIAEKEKEILQDLQNLNNKLARQNK